MSALQQLLAQHSADIEARIQHTNDVDNDIAERKANTIEEKFQHAKDAIESVGAELGTAGGAFHMGRKVYTKYKARQARLAKEKTGGGDSESNTSAERPEAEGDRPTGEGDRPTGEGDRPADPEPAPEGEAAAAEPAAEPAAAAAEPEESISSRLSNLSNEGVGAVRDRLTSNPNYTRNPTTQEQVDTNSQLAKDEVTKQEQIEKSKAQSAEEARDPESHTQPKASESQPATEQSDPATVQGQENRAANVESGQAEESAGTEEANPMEALNTRTSTPLESGGSEPTPRPTNEANVGSPAEANAAGEGADVPRPGLAGDDVEEGARAFMNPETGEARSAANIASRSADNSSILDKGINGAKKVVSNLKSGLGGDAGDAASSILPEVGEALDFLGPIGEFAGLITGLVGLFEGIGHKKAEPKPVSGETGEVAQQTAGTGIDPKALLSEQPTGLAAAV